ncbi:hypothetical protein [Kineococcus glutinatus]|uniref:Acyl-CoA:diacylglycerol acyltransferase n=1 Tax=Kineococcus glutinatus TaxID=1070872 RepID=A0ABP9HCH6_9ACTN
MNVGASAQWTRRSVLAAGALGAVSVSTATRARADTPTSPIPTLPGEVWRDATRTSRLGGKPYEVIDVVQDGDTARLYVPWTAALKGQKPGAMVWYYHSNGSTHTAMDGPYGYPGMLCVDQGVVSICPNFGGSLWTAQRALDLHRVWSAWAVTAFSVGMAFGRCNSGGGSLMTYAYAKGMVRNMRGIYLANGTYDNEELYARDPARIGAPYGNDPALIAATNPARVTQAAWKAKRIKTVVSLVDTIVPPASHGLALADRARPVAADVQVRYHDGGHAIPYWSHTDMMSTFSGWA